MEINYFYDMMLEAKDNYLEEKTELDTLEHLASEISDLFECTDNCEIRDVIEKQADKVINNYMIEMSRKYDFTYSIEQIGYELLCERDFQDKLKETVMECWEDLKEFKEMVDEIVYLSDKHNVLKLLESIN